VEAEAAVEEAVALASYSGNTPADKWRRAKPFLALAFLLIMCPLCGCTLWLIGMVD
jgi:hypothetical protein